MTELELLRAVDQRLYQATNELTAAAEELASADRMDLCNRLILEAYDAVDAFKVEVQKLIAQHEAND